MIPANRDPLLEERERERERERETETETDRDRQRWREMKRDRVMDMRTGVISTHRHALGSTSR
jgi:hypothetical protein